MNDPITIHGMDIDAYHGPERRALGGHTPEDCHKLLGAMDAMKEINDRLDDGSSRMGRIEQSVAEVKAALKAAQQSTDEYRTKTDAGIREVHSRLEVSEKQAEEHRLRIEGNLDENTTTTKLMAADTAEIRDIMTLGKSFFRLAEMAGKVIKWGAGIATAVISLWLAVKYGKPPP